MKNIINNLWSEYQAGLITASELYNKIVDAVGAQEFPPIVVNTEEETRKLEVIINEDDVIFTTEISDELAKELIELGAEEV